MATERLYRNAINPRPGRGDSVAIQGGPDQTVRIALVHAFSIAGVSASNDRFSVAARRSAHIAISHFAKGCRARGTSPERTLIELKAAIAEVNPDLCTDPIGGDHGERRALSDDMIRWCIEGYFGDFD